MRQAIIGEKKSNVNSRPKLELISAYHKRFIVKLL